MPPLHPAKKYDGWVGGWADQLMGLALPIPRGWCLVRAQGGVGRGEGGVVDGRDLEFGTPGQSCLSCEIVQSYEICKTPAQSCNRKTAPLPTGRTSPQPETCPHKDHFPSK